MPKGDLGSLGAAAGPAHLVADEEGVQPTIIEVRIQGRGPGDQRIHHRQARDQRRLVFAQGYGCRPGDPRPVERLHVLGGHAREGALGFQLQSAQGLLAAESEAAQPVVPGAQVQASGPCACVVGRGHVALLGLVGRELHVHVGVLGESARRCFQQSLVLGHLHEQCFDGFQSEGNRAADELYVVVAGINQRVLGQRVTHGRGDDARRRAAPCEQGGRQ